MDYDTTGLLPGALAPFMMFLAHVRAAQLKEHGRVWRVAACIFTTVWFVSSTVFIVNFVNNFDGEADQGILSAAVRMFVWFSLAIIAYCLVRYIRFYLVDGMDYDRAIIKAFWMDRD